MDEIDVFIHGTTMATNALIEKKGIRRRCSSRAGRDRASEDESDRDVVVFHAEPPVDREPHPRSAALRRARILHTHAGAYSGPLE